MADLELEHWNTEEQGTLLQNDSRPRWKSGDHLLTLHQNNRKGGNALNAWSITTGLDCGGMQSGVMGWSINADGVGVEGRSMQQAFGPGGQPKTGVAEPGGSGTGILGITATGLGVHGYAAGMKPFKFPDQDHEAIGVFGEAGMGIGVLGATNYAARPGIWGINRDLAGLYGVIGSTKLGNAISDAIPAGVLGASGSGVGTGGTSEEIGVWGFGKSGAGVIGTSDRGHGVIGSTETNDAVVGIAVKGSGVAGSSDSASGVNGRSKAGIGVFGSAATGTGVFGYAGSKGHGVVGTSNVTTKFGVFGFNDAGMGVGGKSNAGIGVVGGSTRGIGLYAAGPSAAAAVFDGDVFIRGNVVIADGFSLEVRTQGNKNGIARLQDGSERRLCAIESPEAWFEDFGEAKLVGGKAHVALDRLFVQSIDSGHYHVFLTPYGETAGLYVARRTRTGFDIAEHKPGGSSVAFSWRIVAKPKASKRARFAKTTSRRDLARIDATLARNGGTRRNALAMLNSGDVEKPAADLLKRATPALPKMPARQQLNRLALPASGLKRGGNGKKKRD
jgi:hypothetical protein